MPRDKTVVLGLVSSKLPELESQDQLKRRIDEASKYVPLENLAISPQCGFASTMEGNLLTEDEQWRKLKLVVDTATQVWGAGVTLAGRAEPFWRMSQYKRVITCAFNPFHLI